MSKAIENVLFIGLFTTILFWWPWATVPFEVPKVVFFNYFVKFVALIFAYKLLKGQVLPRLDNGMLFTLIIFTVWAVITAFLGVDIAKSFTGNFYRNDGIITLFHLMGFSLLIGYFWTEGFKKKISLAFFASSVTLASVSLFEMIKGSFGLGSAATFGNPNFLAGFLVVTLPFGIYLFKTEKQKLFLIGSIITILAILFIGAISAILTLAIYLIITALTANIKYKYVFTWLLVISASVVTAFWVNDYYSKNRESYIAEGRVRIYRNVSVGIINRPILGYGWANTDKAFESTVWPLKFNDDIYVDKAHSEFLEVAAATGFPGLVIYSVLIAMVILKLVKQLKSSNDKNWEVTILSVFILYLFHSQTNVTSVAEQLIFWLIAGYSLTSPARPRILL